MFKSLILDFKVNGDILYTTHPQMLNRPSEETLMKSLSSNPGTTEVPTAAGVTHQKVYSKERR